MTVQDKRFCVRALTSGKAKTATEVTKKLKENFGVSTSVKTVTQAPHQAGLASGEKKTKPLLSRTNIKLVWNLLGPIKIELWMIGSV